MAPTPVIDIHSHVFNAEDLPIDGFIRKLSPAPGLLTSIVSVPLDLLTQWAASKARDESTRLLRLLQGTEGVVEEAVTELISDEELDRVLADRIRGAGLLPPSELEGVELSPSDAELARALESAPPEELAELDGWLLGWDPGYREELAAATEAEGLLTGALARLGKVKQAVRCFVAALRLVTRHRYEITAELATTYPKVDLFVPALVDFSHTTADRPTTDIRQQIAVHSLVAKLSIAGLLPGAPSTRIGPFVGFDPYREVNETKLRDWSPDKGAPNLYVPFADPAAAGTADRYHRGITFDPARARALRVPTGDFEHAVLELDGVRGALHLVRHAIELGGFLGVKIYPPAGFLPLGNALRFPGDPGERLDAAMRALYAYCVAMDVPILTHAAHSNGFEADHNGFAGPAGWELVLAEYPTLRVCFGHFGHLHGVPKEGGPGLDGWARRFVDLMDRFPNVYADISNSKVPIDEDYSKRFFALLRELMGGDEPGDQERLRRRRLLYGSDFWMNRLTPGHEKFFDGFERPMRSAFGSDGTAAFLGGNALRFLGFVDGDGALAEDNRNRKRWIDFHGSNPPPDWL